MDELDQRLSRVLNRVAAHADDSALRLRNPAAIGGPVARRAGSRGRAGWVTAAVGVAAVVGGVAVTLPRVQTPVPPSVQVPATPQPSSSPSAAATRGKSDGVHPLWRITVKDTPRQVLGSLPLGGAGPVPVPYTLDPRLSPELAPVPTLVTAAGAIRFPNAKSVLLYDQRPQGTYVVTLDPGHDGQDGLFDMHLVLVAPDNSQRELFRSAYASHVVVSPDGTTVAVNTGPQANGDVEPAVVLVEVASGRAVHRLPGSFQNIMWTSDEGLLLGGRTDLRWRAPWTGMGEPVRQLPDVLTVQVAGGTAFVDAKGCLQRTDETATVTAANCGGWSLTGSVSPDGRYLPLTWNDGRMAGSGLLDLTRNEVRAWPVGAGGEVTWLSGSQALVTDSGLDENSEKARCDLDSGECVRLSREATSAELWRQASWLGKR